MKPARHFIVALFAALAAYMPAASPAASSAQGQRNPHAPQVSTRELDLRIAKAEARLAAAGATDADRAAAAAAYVERGNVYFSAGTPTLYRFALGDYRRALRYQPNLSEAREKAGEITRIYETMGRPLPTHGDEPAERLDEMTAKAERLTFSGEPAAAGASGEIARGAVRDYLLAIPAGRRVRVRITPQEGPARNPVSFNFYEARDGAAVRLALWQTDWSGDLEREAQYIVRVGPLTHGARYRLEVTHDRAAETRKF